MNCLKLTDKPTYGETAFIVDGKLVYGNVKAILRHHRKAQGLLHRIRNNVQNTIEKLRMRMNEDYLPLGYYHGGIGCIYPITPNDAICKEIVNQINAW